MPNFLPYGRQHIDDDDIAAVTRVLRSDYLTTGPAVAAFEHALRQATGAAHAVACANGTAALHLAMLALAIGPDDVVVVPSLTFLASANAARYVGAEVLFADVDPETGLLTPDTFRAALARAATRPRCAVVVHLNGQTADLDGLASVAAGEGIALVEDACHALATRHRYGDGEVVVGDCRRSRVACFSFHPVKAVATGEGGAVTTADDGLAERLARLRNHGMIREAERFLVRDLAFDPDGSANPWHYEMSEVGFNYRLDDISCALGTSQLAKLGKFAARRAELAQRYDALLAPLAPLVRPVARVPWAKPVWHLYAVRIDFAAAGRSRATVMNALRQSGIGTQVHYIPVHRQPYYAQRYGALHLPGTEAYFARQLSLPLFVDMGDSDVDRVVGALRDVLDLPT
jgi:UDP-4-amino-4,6-dideoxy-N-acetyl-beta-L-altrosamine transaminase